MFVGDNVQVAIGQGLMAATPLQLANAYSTIANGGFLLHADDRARPSSIRWCRISSPGMADISQAVVYKSFERPKYKDQLEMPPEIIQPIVAGLARVTNAYRVRNPGVTYPSTFYHTTTGERLFESYPMEVLPIAGKTGTAQGANSYPWNDSSAFGAFSLDPAQPIHGRRLPREGRLRSQGRRAGRQVHLHRARRQDGDGSRAAQRSARLNSLVPAPSTATGRRLVHARRCRARD